MPLVLVFGGQRTFLQTVIDHVTLKVGIFKNDRQPKTSDTIANYTPADFSGYSGLQTLAGWSAAASVGRRAVSTAASVAWRHDGGGTNNNVYGVYVVDGAGNLVYAERDPNAPVLIDGTHRDYAYTAILSDVSEYDP